MTRPRFPHCHEEGSQRAASVPREISPIKLEAWNDEVRRYRLIGVVTTYITGALLLQKGNHGKPLSKKELKFRRRHKAEATLGLLIDWA